ncbi:protein RALF-like 24 isoform X2 [Prunus yedoensis var. nudiflora]|uniref:Protein RALF-like 24 isoform X2 n=1 Tax=Prunus yedoensis var. nudiflora TaxID=2094558 RepID=A0A314XND7_PRUYE|nr:protein RALF-like 24 isoform X2 [Prunus yedoensis var. nudiflora]
MSKPRRPNPMLISCLSLLLIHTHFSICNGVSAFDLNSLKGSGIDGMVRAGRACNQKIGDCLTEPAMESETSRRVLAMQKKYISYETLEGLGSMWKTRGFILQLSCCCGKSLQ